MAKLNVLLLILFTSLAIRTNSQSIVELLKAGSGSRWHTFHRINHIEQNVKLWCDTKLNGIFGAKPPKNRPTLNQGSSYLKHKNRAARQKKRSGKLKPAPDLKDLLQPTTTTTPAPTTQPPLTLNPILSNLAGTLIDSFFPSEPAKLAPGAGQNGLSGQNGVSQLAQQLVRTDPFTGEVLRGANGAGAQQLLQQQPRELLSFGDTRQLGRPPRQPQSGSFLNNQNLQGTLFPTGSGLNGRTDLPSNYVYPFAAPGTKVFPDGGGDEYSIGPTAQRELSALRNQLAQRAGAGDETAAAVLRRTQSDAARPAVTRFGGLPLRAFYRVWDCPQLAQQQQQRNTGINAPQSPFAQQRAAQQLEAQQNSFSQQFRPQSAGDVSISRCQFRECTSDKTSGIGPRFRTQPGGVFPPGSGEPWWAQGQGALPFVRRDRQDNPGFGQNGGQGLQGISLGRDGLGQRQAQFVEQQREARNPFDFSSSPPMEFLLPRVHQMASIPTPPPAVPLDDLLQGKTQVDSLDELGFPFVDRAVGRNNLVREARVITTPAPPPSIISSTCAQCQSVTLSELSGTWTQIYGSPESLRSIYTTLMSLGQFEGALGAGKDGITTVNVSPLQPSCVGLQVAAEKRGENLTDAFLHFRDDSSNRRLHEQLGVMELRGKNLLLRLPAIDLPICTLLHNRDYLILTETLGARKCKSLHVFARDADRFFRADNVDVAKWIGEKTRGRRTRDETRLLPVSVLPFPSLCHVPRESVGELGEGGGGDRVGSQVPDYFEQFY